jgi:hypothetical protein
VFQNRVLRRKFSPKRKWREAGEHYIMRSFVTCTLKCELNGQVKEDKMGGECSMHGGDEKCICI